jgi:CheY-like chemotaxis protein
MLKHALFVYSILVASDNTTDAALVKNLLNAEFDHVVMSTDPDKAAGDFVRYRPSVLILAFETLEKSEHYYLGLHRLCPEIHLVPHRTLILCNKDEIKQVYELCKKNYFDDYILFWPMSYDSSRLAMAVHHAINDMKALMEDGPSVAEFAVQARQLASLENKLERQIVKGGHDIKIANLAITQAVEEVGVAFDGLSTRISSGELSDLLEVKNTDGLGKELNRFKREEMQPHFSAAVESGQPLNNWEQTFRQECKPLVESVRAMNAMAGRIKPTVMVVDDNEPQRIILGKLLESQNYNVILAVDGFEALIALRKARPDIILMDMMMPNMSGMEATRKLKAIPRFSKTPVIMITGQSEGGVVVDCLRAGAIDFVVKPYDHAKLTAKIANALKTAVT